MHSDKIHQLGSGRNPRMSALENPRISAEEYADQRRKIRRSRLKNPRISAGKSAEQRGKIQKAAGLRQAPHSWQDRGRHVRPSVPCTIPAHPRLPASQTHPLEGVQDKLYDKSKLIIFSNRR